MNTAAVVTSCPDCSEPFWYMRMERPDDGFDIGYCGHCGFDLNANGYDTCIGCGRVFHYDDLFRVVLDADAIGGRRDVGADACSEECVPEVANRR